MTKKPNNISKGKEKPQDFFKEYEMAKLRAQFCIKSMEEELDDISSIGMFDNESFISRKETIVGRWANIKDIIPTEFNIEDLINQCNNISDDSIDFIKDVEIKKYSYRLAGNILLKKTSISSKVNNEDNSEGKAKVKSNFLRNLFPNEEIIKKRK